MEPKGKPVTTSVPSISIKFHANAEQLEEFYGCDEEKAPNDPPSGATVNEAESSPLKYLPKLVKRSTSIDITNANLDASPPSDPWRFFSDIKGKITKSVEEKITEIKSRNQEDGSPFKSKKDSKENSSVSDSEDFSESSISKTCGIFSTTEGAEMSSDDDTPSIEKDKKTESTPVATSSGLRQRFRLLKAKSQREGSIARKNLTNLYNLNADKIEQAMPDDVEIEKAVDALEDNDLEDQPLFGTKVLKGIDKTYDNIKIDSDNVVNVKEVTGSEVKEVHWMTKVPKTVYAPVGFVDFRRKPVETKSGFFVPLVIVVTLSLIYVVLHTYSTYLAGLMLGGAISYFYFHLRSYLDTPANPAYAIRSKDIVEIPAVKEFQPFTKYEGWMNEFPENYNPHTYHISQTQPVFLRLQGNLLRVSHTRSKVPKRALWNEPKVKPVFTHHRVYNLLGAQVCLLPEGLAKKRHWSKKYPICLTLSKDQMNFDLPNKAEEEKKKTIPVKKKRSHTLRFSKLSEENEDFDLDSDSRGSSPSPLSQDDSNVDDDHQVALTEALRESFNRDDEHEVVFDDDFDSLPEDWTNVTPPNDDSPTPTKLFLFGRTDREKEDWFRRLKTATHKGAPVQNTEQTLVEKKAISRTLFDSVMKESDYMKFMMIINKVPLYSGVQYPPFTNNEKGKKDDGEAPSIDVQWVNALLGRVLFDCLRDDSFTQRIKDKIQRKLASIKLPYFIEGLHVTELSLGQNPPLIHKATKPMIDERGLWVDLDITYQGMVVLILQTKLNLMKLKQPPPANDESRSEKPAMFNSDVEDSAESSSDEESMCMFQREQVLDSTGVPVAGLGGTSNTSKKFMKMVDRIAESKFFQAATEYRYIKKAMEGVSNTDLRLRVEVKELVGTLVLNMPPPPSDRVWLGFRPTPDLALTAQPIVGERNITYLRITSWIEKKLLLEFQKIMVIPNMEDFIVPVMSPKLPE